MAEQEACASAVTDALAAAGEGGEAEDSAGGERGESLLLPLLQGLLHGGGERLLAGLGAASSDVVADVRRSLARLRQALAPPTAHPQARALLTLADRLEDALDAADRLDGCKRRPRRRSRAARHTVGVTHEELEEARRLVDRDHLALAEPVEPLQALAPSSGTVSNTSTVPSVDEPSTPERKDSVDEQVSFHDAVAARQKPAPVAHSVSYEVAPQVNRDARVVERRAPGPKKPEFFRHSIADAPQPDPPTRCAAERWHSESRRGIAAIANKFDAKIEQEAPVKRVPINRPTVTLQNKQAPEEPKRTLYRPPPPTYNFAAPPPAEDPSKPLNRFNANKRARMKRANTIDFGRSLGRMDSDTDDENARRGPTVPEFKPQTENDRKFLAFMQKNENVNRSPANVQANWSSRFGNIKNTFESRERDEHSRSSSASSAKRFWQTSDDNPSAPRPRKFLADITPEIVKPPWVSQRRDSLRNQAVQPPLVQVPQISPAARHPPPTVAPPPVNHPSPLVIPPPAKAKQHNIIQPPPIQKQPPPPSIHLPPPNLPQSSTKPLVVKPFVAKPIPVNQFSHAPMSAFKPPKKIMSPTSAPVNIWSPPSSSNPVSPMADSQPVFPTAVKTYAPSPPPPTASWMPENDKFKKSVGLTANKFENDRIETHAQPSRTYNYHPPTPPTHAPPHIQNYPNQNYPIKVIPSQKDLAAPELVMKLDDSKQLRSPEVFPPKVDAQRLQIEFYERQIREKNRRAPMTNGYHEVSDQKPPAPPGPPAYTIVDYTPANVTSTFVPLQQTPDIEKAKAHKVDYLPDVVMNESNSYEYATSPTTRAAPGSPSRAKQPAPYQNGDSRYVEGTDAGDESGAATEHGSVVTRVMRGPVRGAATITTGVRTRGAADSLRGALDKISSPKRDVIVQIEQKKREAARTQVRLAAPLPAQNGHSPPHGPSPTRPIPAIEHDGVPRSPGGPRSPALAASRESLASAESASRGASPAGPLARSGSWHRLAEFAPKPASPRKVVARTKSMHLLVVPKMFEGGISRDQLPEKQRTVEAYFSGQAYPMRKPRAPRSAGAQPFALGRSRTMPTVAELQFLDESNADDAFEDLVSALS